MDWKSAIVRSGWWKIKKITQLLPFLCIFSARRTNEDHHGIIDLTAFNTDGFDVTGRNVWIHDCVVWAQDDCIAVKVLHYRDRDRETEG